MFFPVRYRPRPLTTAAAILAFGAVGLHVNREDALAAFVMICGGLAAVADVIVLAIEKSEEKP